MSENERTINASITAPGAGKDKNRSGGMDDFSICLDLEQTTEKLTGLFALIMAQFTEINEVGVSKNLPSVDIFINNAADDLISELKRINKRIRNAS